LIDNINVDSHCLAVLILFWHESDVCSHLGVRNIITTNSITVDRPLKEIIHSLKVPIEPKKVRVIHLFKISLSGPKATSKKLTTAKDFGNFLIN